MTPLDKIKTRLRFQIYAKIRANFYPSFYFSHSQFGEDMVVRYLTEGITNGFYVDIGAHHPVYYSNTYHFYCKGWRGINIDAAPGSMDAFNVLRPRDSNLELCLSSQEGQEQDFFVFNPSTNSTFDASLAERMQASGEGQLVETRKLATKTLANCLSEHLPQHGKIDFMSIDVEGMDEEILFSNDWDLHRPRVLIFEKHQVALNAIPDLPIVKHLADYGYQVAAKCGPSLILVCATNNEAYHL